MNLELSSLRLFASAALAVSISGGCETIHNIGDNPDGTGGVINAETGGNGNGGSINTGGTAVGGAVGTSTGGLSNRGTGGTSVGGASGCTSDQDCPSSDVCGYQQDLSCSKQAHCIAGALCNIAEFGCGCDGSTVNVYCGVAAKPFTATGACNAGTGGNSSTGGAGGIGGAMQTGGVQNGTGGACNIPCAAQYLSIYLDVTTADSGPVSGVEVTFSGPATGTMLCQPSYGVMVCRWPSGPLTAGSYSLLVSAPGFQAVNVAATVAISSGPCCEDGSLEPSTVTLDTCTGTDCSVPVTCVHNGQTYDVGSFYSEGCTSCMCLSDGTWGHCTGACPSNGGASSIGGQPGVGGATVCTQGATCIGLQQCTDGLGGICVCNGGMYYCG